MKCLILIATSMAVAASMLITVTPDEEKAWEDFKIKFNRHYATEQKELFRRGVFLKKLKTIREHNEKYKRGEVTFTMGINQFSDWTEEEMKHFMGGINIVNILAKCSQLSELPPFD